MKWILMKENNKIYGIINTQHIAMINRGTIYLKNNMAISLNSNIEVAEDLSNIDKSDLEIDFEKEDLSINEMNKRLKEKLNKK